MFDYIDLFAGIGGFHQAAANNGGNCVFASEINSYAQQAYEANYGMKPHGDIISVEVDDIPDHDMLFAGFPCQPFSIIGNRHGFDDMRGTLFFEIVRILQAKEPPMIVLENVKQLATHDKGNTLRRILEALDEIGYIVDWEILNALDFGLPHKRERTIIIGFREQESFDSYQWPKKQISYTPLSTLLEKQVDERFYASKFIREKRKAAHKSKYYPSIWHENKSGNVSSHPFSCALRAGASYNYLLVNGERRLTPREMLRLQGFPDSFKIVCSDSQTRKQAGNAVPIPMVQAVIREMLNAATEIERFEEPNWLGAIPAG